MIIDSTGYTYCHEHLHIDLSQQKNDIDCRLDQYDLLCEEMRAVQTHGVRNIVEVTNSFMGRNPQFIESLISDTGINVLMSTGFYIEGFFPNQLYQMSAQQIAKVMIDEIELGIEGSSLKASLIGEIGSSENFFSQTEQQVFVAAAIAHLETGHPISTHQSMSSMGKEQLQLLQLQGVDMSKVTVGHCDLRDNIDHILWMLDQGCYVQFDTVGKNSYYPDSKRALSLKYLCDRGYEDQIMLSMDVTRRSHLKANGGLGFSYLIEEFVPLLKQHGFQVAHLGFGVDHSQQTPQMLSEVGISTTLIGKVADIVHNATGNSFEKLVDTQTILDISLEQIQSNQHGFFCINVQETDISGHRQDPELYWEVLECADSGIERIMERMNPQDILVVTADHGNDPFIGHANHTREKVPLLVHYSQANGIDLGERGTLADIGATACHFFDAQMPRSGTSFLPQLLSQ
ncbi:phosphopentomutase [Vibrio gallicus]|uniref:phosphopentomutase n=1 Tax=Vibrio gallicus TaxID=190897 RepID=UPI0021C26D67|nr:phosphopentomutase [Vibrio gallicus]